MPILFATAIFVSAALLFVVQPLAGKIVLPLQGGSPAVWTTCMLFFQGVLVLGYAYAHALSRFRLVRSQVLVHAALVALAWAWLPFDTTPTPPAGEGNPAWWLLATLARGVGPGFLVVSTTGPLLQRWFAASPHEHARNPYALYVASNAGSLLGLLAYPTLIEGAATRHEQAVAWAIGFALLGAGVVACGALAWRHGVLAPAGSSDAEAPTWRARARWAFLAFVPSSLMLGLTQHATTDVAPVPLLWVVPLAIYLATMMWAFSSARRPSAMLLARTVPLAVIAVIVANLARARSPLPAILAVHLVAVTLASMLAHRRLADDRPHPLHLTDFYLWLAIGGALGGVFNSLVAPAVFPTTLEYPLVLALSAGVACWKPPAQRHPRQLVHALAWMALGVTGVLLGPAIVEFAGQFRGWDVLARAPWSRVVLVSIPLAVVVASLCLPDPRFALATFLAVLLAPELLPRHGDLLATRRTFFGVYRVYAQGDAVLLHHGTTLHGVQLRPAAPLDETSALDEGQRRLVLFGRPPGSDPTNAHRDADAALRERHRALVPTTYYHPAGPLGDVVDELQRRGELREIACVGLGSGSLAAYAPAGSRLTFIEIDPLVRDLARDERWFHQVWLAERRADVRVLVRDGRLALGEMEPASLDLLVLDAFTSDAIPMHLLTREAVELYASRLRPGGLLAVHISNRHFELEPVVARLAAGASLRAIVRQDDADEDARQLREFKQTSTWALLARDDAALGRLSRLPTWKALAGSPDDPLWTDDSGSVLRILR